MSDVQPTILDTVESCNIWQDGYDFTRYICSNDGRFLYGITTWNNTIIVNDTYTGEFRTINADNNIQCDCWPAYHLQNGNRIVGGCLSGGVHYWRELTIDSTFTSITAQHTLLHGREWGCRSFVATDEPNRFIAFKRLFGPREYQFFWFDVLTHDMKPIGRLLTANRFSINICRFYKQKIYFVKGGYYAFMMQNLSVVDLTPETVPSDPNTLPILKWRSLDIKEIKPVYFIFATFIIESDYLYAIWQQQPTEPVDCSYLIVYDLINDKYTAYSLKSSFASLPIAMVINDGVLSVYKKKKSKSNGQQITTYRYTLRKPETLTMLAWISSQKLNVIKHSAFPIRSPFVPQKPRRRRSVSVNF
ncbi:hypothetical protein M3Y95_01122000 [Aphelenchoides besseyi]|nr:hypothetical protein M3Y95_01122000 [Aphelenchoides besseyi]